MTWDCVDIKHNLITINKSLNRYRKADYGFTNALGSTKSKTSERTISYNDIVADALIRERAYQMESGIEKQTIPIVDDYGRIMDETNDFVFVQRNGSIWNEPAVVRTIHRIVDKQNKEVDGTDKLALKYFTPHQVRHTYTTLAYEAGADGKVVSMRLGHASEQVTSGTYIHLRGKRKKEQDEVVNKIRIS